MANYIDIKDFDGVLTNADIEDLPDNVAQEIKNLKIQAGKLEKTFGAGTPSGIPTIGLSFVNTTLGTTYTVYNVYTFVSDKFTGNSNEAGDGYRYLLVTVGGDNKTKLWWFDPSLPDVTDHLQVEDNIMWFQTASAHSIVEDDYVLVQDCKNNASPQADISGAGVYEQADVVPSTTTVGINTDSATGYGGSFFDLSLASGVTSKSFGGKIQSHLQAVDSISYGSPATVSDTVYQIAIASMNGKVLTLAVVDPNSKEVVVYDGSSVSDLSATTYNGIKSNSGFKVCSMIGFNNAIYVHYTYGSITAVNPVVKYQLTSGGAIAETVVSATIDANASPGSYMHIANGNLYLLNKGDKLYKITSSDSLAQIPFTNISVTADNLRGLTSIVQTNNITSSGVTSGPDANHHYLFIAEEISGGRCQLYANDLLDTGNSNWYAQGSPFDASDVYSISSMNFKQNSSRTESVVIHYQDTPEQYLKYTTHNNTSVVNGYSNVSSTFGTSTEVNFIASTYNSPSTQYLVVGTNDVTSPASNGSLYLVNQSLGVTTVNTQATGVKATWNPRCFADCVTETHGGQNFFEHAKGYIAIYGTESTVGSSAVASADIYRMTDIGWLANTWNGSGDCDYRWIDLMSYYAIKEVDTSNVSTTPVIYHKKDRNPIVVSGDNIRFLPGAVGKISSTEAKGVWIGHIDRSLFNNTVSAVADWYAYSNKLNNPFSISSTKIYDTGESLRPGNSVKYNITAIYDGIQETLFDKSKELVLSDTDINKKIIELNIEFDANALNKRITGLNVYRATEFTNTTNFDGYSNYQLIGHMTFVDTQNDIPTTSNTIMTRIHAWKDNIVFLKDVDDLTSYDGETLGRNKYALDTDGGFDGIDDVKTWKGPTSSSSSNRPFQFLPYHSELQRTMTASQGYMVVSALAKDNTLKDSADPSKCQLEDEAITISDTTVTAGTNMIYTATISESSPWKFTLNTDLTNTDEFAVNDTFITANHTGITWTITEVATAYLKATPSSGSSYSGATGVIKLKTVASGVIVNITRGQLPITHNVDPTPSVMTTAVSHATGTNIHIRAESLDRSYSQIILDTNAHFGDNYLDDGTMIGSDWKIRKRTTFGYTSTSQESSSGGAYGGQKVAFLFFEDPDDITGTLGTDTTGSLITQNSLAGDVLITNYTVDIANNSNTATETANSESFLIESNSVYEPTLGGCWIKVNKGFGSTSQSDSGLVFENVRILSGFKRTNAQGATTPGMAFNVTSGTNVRVVCQDYQLEDLGETSLQSVYSNRINAQYAVKLKGRMFLGDLYLNPEDKQEERPDWIAYSELNQYDVRPVSNVVTLDDREGGAVTGLAVLFGRLIIFKPQAIFIMNVTDPADSNTWNVTESKFSIGNIAPEGVVEVHDSVYFVFHDGIYAVTSNMVADSTKTPSVMDKISLSIEDQFLLANSKKDIKGVYNQKDSEILYTWEVGSPATQVVWAYHIVLKTWRKVETTTNLDILAYGENSYPIAWDNTDTDIKKFDVDEAVGTAWKSKRFRLDLDQKRLIRYGMVKFTGTDTLTVNIYLDSSGSVSFTKSITADGGVNRFPIKRYGKNFEIELTTPSSTNSFSVEQMRIETE